MDQEIALHSNHTGKGFAWLYFSLAVVMSLIGLTVWANISSSLDGNDAQSENLLTFVVAFAFGCLVVGLLLNMVYAMRFAKKPVLTFNALGIIDYTRLLPVGLIRWDEVEEIFLCEFYKKSGSTRMLRKEIGIGVKLRNKADFVARYGLLTRIMIRLQSWPGYFIIRTYVLNLKNTDLASLIDGVGKAFGVRVSEYRKVGDGK
jgi:hypothetical protein